MAIAMHTHLEDTCTGHHSTQHGALYDKMSDGCTFVRAQDSPDQAERRREQERYRGLLRTVVRAWHHGVVLVTLRSEENVYVLSQPLAQLAARETCTT